MVAASFMSIFMPLLMQAKLGMKIVSGYAQVLSTHYSENQSSMPLSTDASVQRGGFDLLFS